MYRYFLTLTLEFTDPVVRDSVVTKMKNNLVTLKQTDAWENGTLHKSEQYVPSDETESV